MKNKMNKIIEAIKTKRWVHYLIIVIIGLLISIPFLWVQLYLSDDGKYHLLRLIGLDNSMEYGAKMDKLIEEVRKQDEEKKNKGE